MIDGKRLTREELLEKIFSEHRENLEDDRLRITRVRIPGKEMMFANIIGHPSPRVYVNLALNIGAHQGEDHTGESIGLMQFTPWESVVIAADVATKEADVSIGFMDRFNGSLIILGELSNVRSACEGIEKFFIKELGFTSCGIDEI